MNQTVFCLAVTWGLMLSVLSGCSSQTAYLSGQAWRQNQCQTMTNIDDRQRCMKDASQPYERYQQEADKARSGP